MTNQQNKQFLTIAMLALALIVPACSSSPTEPQISLNDLLAQFVVQMGANTAAGGSFSGSSASGLSAASPAGAFKNEPSEREFNILGPVLNVFSWPIIQDTRITARWGGSIGETMQLGWPGSDFPAKVWPDLEVAGGVRFGNTWVVYPAGGNPNNWVAQHTEWIRRPGEQSGTTFPFGEKLEANPPCNNCPIGQFITGPSRFVPNRAEYRRRTVIKWFRYDDLTPWTWADDPATPAPGPGPEAPEELQEVHVLIQSFRVETTNGTVVTFGDVNRDIDLMTLRGQVIDLVDTEVPRGTFNDIQFNVDTAKSYVVVDGERRTLHFSSSTVVVQGPIIVGDAPITTVRLELDLDQSLSENSDGTWTMAPVVVISVTTG